VNTLHPVCSPAVASSRCCSSPPAEGVTGSVVGALAGAWLVLIGLDISQEWVRGWAAPPVAAGPARAPAHT
jgi:hypothetical protein